MPRTSPQRAVRDYFLTLTNCQPSRRLPVVGRLIRLVIVRRAPSARLPVAFPPAEVARRPISAAHGASELSHLRVLGILRIRGMLPIVVILPGLPISTVARRQVVVGRLGAIVTLLAHVAQRAGPAHPVDDDASGGSRAAEQQHRDDDQ